MTLNDSCWAHRQLKAWSHFHRSCFRFMSPSASTWAIDFESKWPQGSLLSSSFLTWIWHRAVLVLEKNAMITGRGRCWVRESHHHLDQYKCVAGICKLHCYWLHLGILPWQSHFFLTFYFILADRRLTLLWRVTFLKKESIAVDDNIEIFGSLK